ncbi:glutathione binding-like protein [Polaromonas sp.]|uniref:glutathione binding-like protein n=1 Tax=Polaromonas sp. TaxID=1869339 RepID=UPI002730E3CB|nr:glutathione binding-like protein [Polaromonas sp.]MDP1740802.1 glutathione binding-like protein [Polaromonas sp.]
MDYAFSAGEEISIADFAIVGWVWRHERHKIDLADFSNVLRWCRGMMARDGVGRGFGVRLNRVL